MLRLTRKVAVPEVLRTTSLRRRNAEDQIAATVAAGGSPKSTDFPALWSDPGVRRGLFQMHNGRCCYCERLRDDKREADIEHFRPKARVAEEGPDRPGYWWLAYEWTNLFFACKTCNEEFKKSQFPIQGVRANDPDDSLDEEQPVLLDPVLDDVDAAIGFDRTAQMQAVLVHGVGENEERAMKTARLIGLNRPQLLKERWCALQPLEMMAKTMIKALEMNFDSNYIKKVAADIRRITSRKGKVPFIGMKRKYFRSVGLGEYVSTD